MKQSIRWRVLNHFVREVRFFSMYSDSFEYMGVVLSGEQVASMKSPGHGHQSTSRIPETPMSCTS